MEEGLSGQDIMIKKYIWMGITLLLFYGLAVSPVRVQAVSDMNEALNYDEIQAVIDDVLDSGTRVNFGDYINKMVRGEESFSLSNISSQLVNSIKGEITSNMDTFVRLISITLLAAIFSNLSVAFKNNQVSETGYYVTYLLLFSLLIMSFIQASQVAVSVMESILNFMRALVPSYFLSIGFCTGSTTSMVYFEAALIMITIVDVVIIKIIIPMINFYLIISLVNNLSKEDMLSRLAGLFASVINWLLKSLLAAVIGFHAIQGLILPMTDKVKRSAFMKASEAIPGIGNAFGGVADTIISAAVLLKNSIGVAGLVVIITICAVPCIKLMVITMIFKISGAALQPVSDKRIIECISASGKSAGMLLHAVFVGAILFILSITIVAVATSSSV